MGEEAVSKNFIEQEIDKDLTDPISAGAEWISAYWTCQIHYFKFRTRGEISRNLPPSV